MVIGITTLIIGFSVFSAIILLLAYAFFLSQMTKTPAGIVACAVLLATLIGLQLQHFRFMRTGVELFDAVSYVIPLLIAPPAFYFFSREVLLPERRPSWKDVIHAGPLLLFLWLPANIVAPIAFVIGTGYAFWFTMLVYGMRRQKRRFRFEMFFFSLFAVLALLVLVLGFSIPYLDPALFYFGYANAIGLALLLIVAALIIFPDLLNDISEAARATYATSTLGDIDVDALIKGLERLMQEEKIYQQEDLSLSSLATALDISAHQLSELINTRFGIGFSRYIREHRVAAARHLLEKDASASVLSIGLSTGFRSQSNFYAAFREITGEAPGTYRKKHHSSAPTS